jgi:membrane-bound lytic murein transglycosylase B
VDIRAGIANARSGMVYRTRKPDPRPRAASSRPAAGRRTLLGALALLGMFGPALADPAPNDFDPFIAGLWPAAQAQGVSRKTFDAAAKGLHFDPKIAAHTQHQAEFLVPVWTYLAGAVIPARIVVGRKQYAALHDVLARAQRVYGVDPGPIMGAWGVETEFGAFSGGQNVLDALATLGFMRYQGDFGRDELLAAMRIVEAGDTPPGGMRGSWAGAMGQPQFLPSSFLKYAVDFDGDGKRDIWGDKTDVLGSIAHFLAAHGWTAGLPWAVEVTLPAKYKYDAADFSGALSFAEFARKGALPKTGAARLYMPAGAAGPILLVTHNFDVIKTYNNSNAYVLAVGLLGDAIVGRAHLRTPWPTHAHALSEAEVKTVQTQLKALGFEIGDPDGRAGPKLERAIRTYQFMKGLTPDGYASPALLARLKAPT